MGDFFSSITGLDFLNPDGPDVKEEEDLSDLDKRKPKRRPQGRAANVLAGADTSAPAASANVGKRTLGGAL